MSQLNRGSGRYLSFMKLPPHEVVTTHEEFDVIVNRLRSLLKKEDPLILLSVLSFYNMSHRKNKSPEETHPRFSQSHIELAQAMTLQLPLGDQAKVHDPAIVQKIIDLLEEIIRQSMSEVNISNNKLRAIEHVRNHTANVRNWATLDQVREYVTSLFAPIETEIESFSGVKVTGLLEMFDRIKIMIERRITSRAEFIRLLMKSKTIDEATTCYLKFFPEDKHVILNMQKKFIEESLGLKAVQVSLINFSDHRLPNIFTLKRKDFQGAYPGSAAAVEKLLARFCMSFGDLKQENPEHFFLGNPIWTKPIIKLDEDNFFIPILSLVTHYIFQIVEDLIRGNKELIWKYEKRRAEYLEEKIALVLTRSFQGAKTYSNVIWSDEHSGTQYENDIVVIYDSNIFLVEAKSGRVSVTSKRGGDLSLMHDVTNLVSAPAVQSKRLADLLIGTRKEHGFTTKAGEEIRVDTSKIQTVIRLSITLEEFGLTSLGSNLLRQAGFLTKDAPITPIMSLAHLEFIMNVLRKPWERLHYLWRREHIENDIDYIGDEQDLLALYVETGFCLEAYYSVFEKESVLYLYGASVLFHNYQRPNQGRIPSRRYTDYWQQILRYIHEKRFVGWSSTACTLLSVDYETAKNFEKEMRKVSLVAKAKWGTPEGEPVLTLPIQLREGTKYSVVWMPYRNLSRYERNERMMTIGRSQKGIGATRSLVIAQDVVHPTYPYNAITHLLDFDQ